MGTFGVMHGDIWSDAWGHLESCIGTFRVMHGDI